MAVPKSMADSPRALSLEPLTPVPGHTLLDPSDSDVIADIVIIGSGMGGATLAYALRGAGASVLVVERGDFLPREFENWSAEAVFTIGRYKNSEAWYDSAGNTFTPGVYYYVGGCTKFYGAALPRFRETDFGAVAHPDGVSAAWPVTYEEMEPFYLQAEQIFRVHGKAGDDPTDPWRSADYPQPPMSHESPVAELADAFTQHGLHAFAMPTGVDYRPGGRCIRCRTCDGFPCLLDAKCDADISAMRPALADGDVKLLTRTKVERLATDGNGRRVTSAIAVRDGRQLRIRAGRYVVSCGAVNSAMLLLRSASPEHPQGLANHSRQVGRNYMVHNSTFLVGVDPRRRNTIRFQKTLGINDWYLPSSAHRYPLGNIQMLGKLQGSIVKGARRRTPMSVLEYVTNHSLDFYLTTEDVPNSHSWVAIDNSGNIVVHWKPTNLSSHRQLVREFSKHLRAAGYPLIFTQRMGIETNSHQCGTVVAGNDPATSVLDNACKAHEVDNLWVVDSSFFPSSAAVNPALTVAANALRVAAVGSLTA